jgi:tetratricopeptide (TPR) repeat protein
MAADLARASSRSKDAIALYEGALARNPFMRDALYFLSYLYYEAKEAAKMLPLTDRLIDLDPSNGDNYLMRAYAYQLMAQAERDVRKKQDLIKQQDAMAARETQLSSLHKVVVNRFERREAGAVLGGVIENLSRAPKGYSLTVEFLDAAGTVLETMTAEVASVAAGQRGTFELTATKPGVAAFRYKPLPVPTATTPTR